jgi:hypothetical protein
MVGSGEIDDGRLRRCTIENSDDPQFCAHPISDIPLETLPFDRISAQDLGFDHESCAPKPIHQMGLWQMSDGGSHTLFFLNIGVFDFPDGDAAAVNPTIGKEDRALAGTQRFGSRRGDGYHFAPQVAQDRVDTQSSVDANYHQVWTSR